MSGEKIFTASTDGIVRAYNIDWDFVRSYLRVLSGDVEDVLGQDDSDAGEDEDQQDTDINEVDEFILDEEIAGASGDEEEDQNADADADENEEDEEGEEEDENEDAEDEEGEE